MFKGSLKKIWSSIIDHIVKWILGVILGGSLVVFKDWIWKHLTATHSADIPLWGWVVLCVVISCTPAIILKIIDIRRRQEVLTDKDDIFNKLYWWLGQQLTFVKEQTEDNKMVTWHFSVIDKKLGLNPGSAEKVLPKMLNKSPKLFPIKLLNKGEKTIALRYDL